MERSTDHAAQTPRRGFTRRNFLKGGALAGAAAFGAAALAGCSPSGGSAAQGADGAAASDEELIAQAYPDAEPIAPAAEPDSWTDEADAVIVGLGGGGLNAAAYLAQQGMKVIGIEKEGNVGGASRHAGAIVNIYGGAKSQDMFAQMTGAGEGYGWPVYPRDIKAFTRAWSKMHQYSTDDELVASLTEKSGEAFDWMLEQPGVEWTCVGFGWIPTAIVTGKQNNVLGMSGTIDAIEAAAKEAGADLRTNVECTALVQNDAGDVTGVRVSTSDGEAFIKAKKAVILCAGGYGMNRDMIAKFSPSAAKGTVQGGPFPSHTGEAIRMGLGAGADYAGYDSWSCWESAIDEETAGGDGEFWHYFWHGERQLFHNPTLMINRSGARVPFYCRGVQPDYQPDAFDQMGDMSNCSAWMSTVGHRVYSVFDDNFRDNVFKMKLMPETGGGDTSRTPLTKDAPIVENGFTDGDWLAEVEQAIERGAIKKADTIAELAEMLTLDPDVLQKAVDDWNRICEAGVDDEMAVPYDPSWLNALKTPPYYGAILGGQMAKTLCGLRVNGDLQVLDADGTPIKGLYANFTTAGGICGDCDHGGAWNPSMLGGIGLTFASGYVAAKSVAAL